MNWIDDHQVLAFESQRQQALLTRDWAAMEQLLAPDLRYTHATGMTHDRATYLKYLLSGPVFEKVHVTDASVLASGDVAVLKGGLQMQFCRAGESQSQSAQSVLTQVWCRHASGWQLVLFQSTKEANPT
jgi:ketosteroid isomerase-like protein